jgi:hypothetical protein
MRRIDLPLYPKSFIASARLTRERDRVFVAMPFNADHSNDLWGIIQSACLVCQMNVHRADESVFPNPIIADILEELERAEVIICDLTGMNSNVFYELGIAHVRCDSVILLCQEKESLPFDLASIRCIFFNLTTTSGRQKLIENLSKTLEALRSSGSPIVIDSSLERTSLICKDLEKLASLSDEELANQTIWLSGFLTSFAIDPMEFTKPEEEEYKNFLLKEKEHLLQLARRGCQIKAIITPLFSKDSDSTINNYSNIRMNSLYNLITDKNEAAIKNIEWTVSPYRQKNTCIIGNISFFEGFKKGIQRGYGLTLRLSGYDAIKANISLYEALFDRLATYTLCTYGQNIDQVDRKTALKLSVIRCLEQSLTKINKQQ